MIDDKNNQPAADVKADNFDKEKEAANKEKQVSGEGNTPAGNDVLNEQKETD